MTPNELAAQLREKAAKAAAGLTNLSNFVDAYAEFRQAATSENLTTILDAYEKMREALKTIGCRFMNDTLCSTKPLDRMCYVCGALASLDAEIEQDASKGER